MLTGCVAPSSPKLDTSSAIPEPVAVRSILLTNDDGWDSAGIVSMRTALTRAGYDVTLVAPRENWSGASQYARGGSLRAERPDPATTTWWVDGTPVDSVRVGLTGVLAAPPDLVISGINHGANAGFGIEYSGTVGAASAGAEAGVPAIAVSADVDASGVAQFDEASATVLSLIQNLDAKGFAELGAHRVINVNVPAGVSKGVRLATQAQVPWTKIDYSGGGGGVFEATPVPAEPTADDSDIALIRKGFTTVTVLDVLRDGSGGSRAALNSALARFADG
jgi:5'/3'-nucleotidase SurE